MSDKFTPTPEMLLAVARAICPLVKCMWPNCVCDPNPIEGKSNAVILALATMIAEECAKIFDAKAAVHAAQAHWIGPNREYYVGARIPGIEMSPMNGPALSHDKALANAAAIRAKFGAP